VGKLQVFFMVSAAGGSHTAFMPGEVDRQEKK
jgi:hypothetical protein